MRLKFAWHHKSSAIDKRNNSRRSLSKFELTTMVIFVKSCTKVLCVLMLASTFFFIFYQTLEEKCFEWTTFGKSPTILAKWAASFRVKSLDVRDCVALAAITPMIVWMIGSKSRWRFDTWWMIRLIIWLRKYPDSFQVCVMYYLLVPIKLFLSSISRCPHLYYITTSNCKMFLNRLKISCIVFNEILAYAH